MILFIFIYFLSLKILFIHADTCTWNNCPKWNHSLINIHLVPHTHDDLGYRKTVDQYFNGGRPDLVKVGVRYIFNTLITELAKDPARKFSYCETGFLQRWFDDSSTVDRQTLIKFVQNGQLEFIGGGWVMPDEATTHYVDLIDLYTLGLRILNETFGECGHPKVNWQIDPFGHSREHANLAKLMGYNSLFFAREHYLEHIMRLQNKSLQTNWHVSEDNGNTIFTGAFYNHYAAPPGFCWDILCSDDPIVDNPLLENNNVDQKLNDFMTYINERIPTQLHNHFLVLMGQDFTYQDSYMWYTNIDKLIYHLNTKFPNVTAFYSTPSCYVQAVNQLNITWPIKNDDFFPYAFSGFLEGNHSYWTGYFTSKPTMKGIVRQSSSLLQLIRQLNTVAFAPLTSQISANIQILEKAAALSQHHDGITGTSAEFVTQDYIYRLVKGWSSGEQVINNGMNYASQNAKKNSTQLPTQYICRNVNESDCWFTKNNTHYTVTVHNGNSKNSNTLIRIPLYENVGIMNLTDGNGNLVDYQIVNVFANPGQINNSDISFNEICFQANVGPLGFQTYFVGINQASNFIPIEKNDIYTRSISNGLVQLDFDAYGYLSTFYDLTTGKNYSIRQEFAYYHGHNNANGEQSGDPYIFRPDGTTSYNFSFINLNIINGPLVNEARQIVAPWVSQSIRLLPNKTFVEFEWTIGPIPTQDNVSKEVFTRYTLNGLNTNGVFWTDANGRQLIKRIRNHAEQYQYENTEPIAANYFPLNSRLLLSDGTTSLALLTDRSHGGTSLIDGQAEIMLSRLYLSWNHFAGNEPKFQPGRDGRGIVVRGKHWLVLGNASYVTRAHRTLAYEMFNAPILTFSTYNDTDDVYRNNFLTMFSGLIQPLPSNINLLTLKQLDNTNILLRLEHIHQLNEDPVLSLPVSIDLTKIFSTFTIGQIQELSLAANSVVGILINSTITINPMEIKTYQIMIQQSNASSSTTTAPTLSTIPINLSTSNSTPTTPTPTATNTTTTTAKNATENRINILMFVAVILLIFI